MNGVTTSIIRSYTESQVKVQKASIPYVFILFFVEYEPKRDLRFVKIIFDAKPYYDRVIKDRAEKFVDMLSAIGGTMGLLTGFSIISGVEIVYFAAKIILDALCRGFKKKRDKKTS